VGRLRDRLLWPLYLLQAAQGMLFPFVPLFLGLGIGAWFGWNGEPGPGLYLAAAGLLLAGLGLRRAGPELLHPPAVALACVAAGFLAAGLRAHAVQAPVLEFRYYGPIQGRVVEIDRSQTDALRLTLDQVVLDRVAPDRTPERVRISLRGQQGFVDPEPGQVVMLTGHLAAPEGPTEPGAFDFSRMAFFDRLGAVGYTQSPLLLWAPPEPGAERINRLRRHLSGAVMAAIPGDSGAFAAGVLTGDRSGLSLPAVVALRDSSLAHLLAISGMNMAFLAGFVFALLRYGLALAPPLALRVNAKKIAAVAVLGVCFFYLLLSGANVATERAFIMISVMLLAVLLDRRALTLRSVSLAAVVILLWQPESMLEPGFQMSFAATVALIAGFGALESRIFSENMPRWAMAVFTLVLSSVIAGFATAPYAAAHFNRFADYGLLANLMTVPVMGAVVMPAGALAALAAPFGLAALPLWVMEQGCDWILWVAHWIAGLEGAVTAIPAPGPWVLPVLTAGAIFLVAWPGRLRWAGALPVLAALALWAGEGRPRLLLSADGSLAGLMGPDGRSLSAPRGQGFAARNWLENDGDLAVQEAAAARPGFAGPPGARSFRLGPDGPSGVVLKGRQAAAGAAAACAAGGLVVVAAWLEEAVAGDCLLIDRAFLARSGPLAVHPAAGGGLLLEPARRVARLWSPQPPWPAERLVWAPAAPRQLAAAQTAAPTEKQPAAPRAGQ
jgi:competence protein ComEC